MDNEPMFVLLARDPQAPDIVEIWANQRAHEISKGRRPASDMDQVNEARATAQDMRDWREANDGAWRTGLFQESDTPLAKAAQSTMDALKRGDVGLGVVTEHRTWDADGKPVHD
jgi:hypothetical protein